MLHRDDDNHSFGLFSVSQTLKIFRSQVLVGQQPTITDPSLPCQVDKKKQFINHHFTGILINELSFSNTFTPTTEPNLAAHAVIVDCPCCRASTFLWFVRLGGQCLWFLPTKWLWWQLLLTYYWRCLVGVIPLQCPQTPSSTPTCSTNTSSNRLCVKDGIFSFFYCVVFR